MPIAGEHVPLVVELDSDPSVKRFIDGGKPSTVTEAEDFVASSLGHRWMAFTTTERAFAGWFGLVPGPAGQRELGYRIRTLEGTPTSTIRPARNQRTTLRRSLGIAPPSSIISTRSSPRVLGCLMRQPSGKAISQSSSSSVTSFGSARYTSRHERRLPGLAVASGEDATAS
jgi:hypothetical protein